MWNDAVVCAGRICFNIFVGVWSEQWNSLERESVVMFYVPLMCCECMDFSLLTSVYPIQRATASWDSTLTGSRDALCIQPSALELSVNAKFLTPVPFVGWSCRWSLMMLGILGGST